jgi:hypothetical protein
MKFNATIQSLNQATCNQEIRWREVGETRCFTTLFQLRKYIICRVETDEDKQAVSIDFLDANNMLVGDMNRREEGEDGFAELNALYNYAMRTAHAPA